MNAILSLIRFPNLLIIALTQYLIRWSLMHPYMQERNMQFQLGEGYFFLLVLSTVLIAAAGYAINDYFDTRIDRVNKPDRVVIGSQVDRRLAMILHIVMNGAAILIGLLVSYKAGNLKLVILQAGAATALWFYSVDLKHRFLAGNLLIAALAFLIPVIPALYELPGLQMVYGQLNGEAQAVLLYINYLVIGYALFAFLTNLVREIIKDIEDIQGDMQYGSKTIPIMAGIPVARVVVSMLLVVTIFLLVRYGMIPRAAAGDWLTFVYLLLAAVAPLLIAAIQIFLAETPQHYRRLSYLLKAAMLGGILSMPVMGILSKMIKGEVD